MATPVTDTEYAEIVFTLREGATCGGAARKHERSKDTIRRIARDEGIDFVRTATKRASEASAAWNMSKRVELVGKGMAHAEKMLSGISEAKDLQSWMVAVGTGIDKIRLEEGEATERGEHTYTEAPTLEEEFARLDSEMEGEGWAQS